MLTYLTKSITFLQNTTVSSQCTSTYLSAFKHVHKHLPASLSSFPTRFYGHGLEVSSWAAGKITGACGHLLLFLFTSDFPELWITMSVIFQAQSVVASCTSMNCNLPLPKEAIPVYLMPLFWFLHKSTHMITTFMAYAKQIEDTRNPLKQKPTISTKNTRNTYTADII